VTAASAGGDRVMVEEVCEREVVPMVVVGSKVQSEHSLKARQKMKEKMKVKMTIFVKSSVGFDFSKMIIFGFILVSFCNPFLKMRLKMKPKMSRKWCENDYREQP
jgi:hypothetical protein